MNSIASAKSGPNLCPRCKKLLTAPGASHTCEPTTFGCLAPPLVVKLVLLLLFVLPACVHAQDEDWHPVDHPTVQSAPSMPPIVLPKRKPTCDKRFAIVTGLHLASTLADTETTRHFLMGTRCVEQNFLLGPRPSTAAVYGLEVGGLFAVTTVGTYFWKRHLERYGRSHETTAAWATLPVILTVGHSVAAWDNGSCF